MYVIEFETDLTDRLVEIKEYEKVANRHAKVIILAGDVPTQSGSQDSMAGVFASYAKPELAGREQEIAWDAVAKERSALS